MSEDFDDLFADSASFSPYQSTDYQFLTPMVSSGVHTENTDTPCDDGFDWFNVDDRKLQHDGNTLGSSEGEEDWFSNDSSTPSYVTGTRSPFDDLILSTRNGSSRRVMTSISDFTRTLAKMGVDGPRLFKYINLDRGGRVIGVGTQFTVFIMGGQEGVVVKRVNKISLDPSITGVSKGDQLRSYIRTLELEVLSLCHPPLRDHRNIIDLISWGYDYPTPDKSTRLPVLVMEAAMTSLSSFLQTDTTSGGSRLSWEIKHQLCLDISDGLEVLHNHGIVHGDIKPDNVFVFKQENPNVPYLGKLSDFGVCIWMEESSSLNFSSYLGTPGWIPAEVAEYQEALHGKFSPELLMKCDSFSYGMVVLSVLLTGGRPPFQDLGGEEEGEEGGREGSGEVESPCDKALGLIWGNEDESFPASLRSKLTSLCRALLKEKPQDRADVGYFLLADNSKGYKDWVVAKEISTKTTRVKVEGRVVSDSYKGIPYWLTMQPEIRQQLEDDYIGTKNDDGPGFPSETIFGLAISITMSRPHGFREKILGYMGDAAKASYFPAQAIIKRLYEAHEQPLATIADDQLVETWLFNAASTGSFVAAEDLEKANPTLLQKAKASFRKAGGYNCELLNITDLQGQFSTLSVELARGLCDEKGSAEFIVDLDGNRLLHVAAMFDRTDVINYLVKERGAAVDSQNDKGETPLYKACLAGHHSTVESLIALSADASITCKKYQQSPLHWLFNFEEQYILHIAQLLITKGKAKVDAIIASEKIGKSEEHIQFVHFPFHWPLVTPLHWAASTRSITAIDALLSLGADIDATDSKVESAAQTVLAMAARRGDSKIVRYLLKREANAKKVDGLGRNPLHMMASDYGTSNRLFVFWEGFESWVYNGSYSNHLREVRECVFDILKAGGDLDGQKGTGNTPLVDASHTKDCVVALALLEAGANSNCLDTSSVPPLHIWARIDNKLLAYPEGFPILFQQLIERTKDLDMKVGYLDETVTHFITYAPYSITKEDYEERIRLLTTHNPPANINAHDKQGRTPLMLALQDIGLQSAAVRCGILLRYNACVDFGANKDGRDFIFIICFNLALTDSESLHLLKRLLEGYSDAEKLQMTSSSVSRVFGNEVPALKAAIKEGKFNCVKYLIGLGMDPNKISGERSTVLDWALHHGESSRRYLLGVTVNYFTVSERKEAIKKDLVFGVKIRDDITVFGAYGMQRENYLGLPKIINYLVSIGAKRGKDFVEDGLPVPNPTEWDEQFTQDTDGWFTVEDQPYYEEWKLLYSLCS